MPKNSIMKECFRSDLSYIKTNLYCIGSWVSQIFMQSHVLSPVSFLALKTKHFQQFLKNSKIIRLYPQIQIIPGNHVPPLTAQLCMKMEKYILSIVHLEILICLF